MMVDFLRVYRLDFMMVHKDPRNSKVRNIDASQSEYTGDLRVIFNAPTSFQIIDDSNAIVSQGALRDGEADTEVSVLGIKFSF